MGTDQNNAVNDEVEKMLENDTIEEVQYPTWLANLVVVLKKNGKWRVCIDFTNLNKACPKDNFPLPHIDMIIDATVGHELMSFMDAFSGDNRIMMHPLNREKTYFITERGAYCYKVIHFGLKNSRETYQRMVNKMFSQQLGLTMEAYIDDMLGKSKDGLEHVDHLWECFQILLVHSMRLNPAKYAFPVSSGKFLGHLNQGRLFFSTSPYPGTRLAPYWSKSKEKHSYRYTTPARPSQEQKAVMTLFPLKKVLHKPEISGRLMKWAVELSEFDIQYLSQITIKGQALEDFLVEIMPEQIPYEGDFDKSDWLLKVDGSSNIRGSGLGIVLLSPEGEMLEQSIKLGFWATDNDAEYEAFIHGIKLVREMGAGRVKKLASTFEYYQISQMPREANMHTDALASLGSSSPLQITKTILFDFITKPSIMLEEEVQCVATPTKPLRDLRHPILEYLRDDKLPLDLKEARKIVLRASRYTLLQDQLYRRSYHGPYLKCVGNMEGELILTKVHEGECSSHFGGRVTAQRI
ncbi:uncharacterized protein LOC133031270 [Cannabis sativa]|uniref:uncharacterized protein LOC133031270 n=1 Tax=Cannabis sativa TaxID=3483 RepID=UPI0029CA4C6F|nr:uncharacterized protein LOC133031270 [Cannabis sativa]